MPQDPSGSEDLALLAQRHLRTSEERRLSVEMRRLAGELIDAADPVLRDAHSSSVMIGAWVLATATHIAATARARKASDADLERMMHLACRTLSEFGNELWTVSKGKGKP